MNLYKNKILSVVLFLTVLFVLNGNEFFHHHNIFIKDDNCQACIFSHALASSDINQVFEIYKYPNFDYFIFMYNASQTESQKYSIFSDRAPPQNYL